MRGFQFSQRCHSQGRLLVDETLNFLRLIAEAFGRSGWIDYHGDPVKLTRDGIDKMLYAEKENAKRFERFGITWVGKAIDKELPPVLIYIAMGGDEWAINYFSVDFSNTDELPDLKYFRRSIELIKPFEAHIHSTEHAWALRDALPWPRPPSKDNVPEAIYWFHYLSGAIAENLGGLAHCLATPAYQCEPFLDGVLIQLTREPFDLNNQEHCEIQKQAMKHLGVACAFV